jgi:hypothetical protein
MKTNPVVKFFEDYDVEALLEQKDEHVTIGKYRTASQWPKWVSWAKQGLSPHDIAGRRRQGTADVVEQVLFAMDMHTYRRWNTDRLRQKAYDMIVAYFTMPDVTAEHLAEAYSLPQSEVNRIVGAVNRRALMLSKGIKSATVRTYDVPKAIDRSKSASKKDRERRMKQVVRSYKTNNPEHKGRNLTARVKK